MKNLHQKEKQELQRILSQYGQGGDEDLLAILDCFLATDSHLSDVELQRRLKNRGLNYDLEAVRDALEVFRHLGFAQAKQFDGREEVFEHKHLGQHHDHLICTKCGRVEEFVNTRIEELQDLAAKEKGFVPLDHRLDIYGLCGGCSKERPGTAPLCEAREGERLVVCGFVGGAELERRLMDMGLSPGVEIEVLGSNGGPLVVACRGSRLALGRGLSEKVLVAPAKFSPGHRACRRRTKPRRSFWRR
ncbi:MAG: transcriptional repressor [Pseudomonadota bacterium]